MFVYLLSGYYNVCLDRARLIFALRGSVLLTKNVSRSLVGVLETQMMVYSVYICIP